MVMIILNVELGGLRLLVIVWFDSGLFGLVMS